jgi:ribosome-associated protein
MAARKTTKKPKQKASRATATRKPKPTGKAKQAPKRAGASARPASAARKPRVGKAAASRKPTGARAAAGTRKRAPLKSKRPAARPRKPVRAARPVAILKENPAGLALARTIARVAHDKKASDVLIIDTRLRGAQVGYDYVVLASGDSDRQLEAIADAVEEALAPGGIRATSIEAASDWVLVNYTDVVAHFFTPDKRAVYDLEGLWSDVPRVQLT